MPNPSGSEISVASCSSGPRRSRCWPVPRPACSAPARAAVAAPPPRPGRRARTNPFGVAADAPLDVVIFNGGFGEEYAKYDEQLYTKAFPSAKIAHNATQKISDTLQPASPTAPRRT